MSTLAEVAAEVTRQRETRRDYLVPSPQARFVPELEGGARNVLLEFDAGNDGAQLLPIKDHVFGQLATYIDAPKRFVDRLREEEPELLTTVLNRLVQKQEDDVRLVRCLDGNLRAWLSNSYRSIDNFELAEAILPALSEARCDVVSSAITDRRLYFKAVSQMVRGTVRVGDIHHAGFVVSNSEVGEGATSLEWFLWRLACSNGQVTGSVFRKHHLGSRLGNGGDAVEYRREDTQRVSDAALFLELRDLVAHSLSDEGLEKVLIEQRKAAELPIEGDPVKVVEVASKKLDFSDGERSSVLKHLIQGGDLTKFGLANAITRTAQDLSDYDRSVDFEKSGHKVITLAERDWKTIATAGASAE